MTLFRMRLFPMGARLRAFAVLWVALAFLAYVASANALTLGSNNVTDAATYGCLSTYSWVQRATAATSPSYSAPYAGTITSWTAIGGPEGGTAALQIWRPTSNPSQFIAVAQSATETIPATNTLTTFASSIPVKKGDVIGIAVLSGLPSCFYTTGAQPGDVIANLAGDPMSGTQTFTDVTAYGPSRLNLSVKLRTCLVPKLKGKTLSAAKDALADAHCGLGKVTRKESSGTAGIVLSQKPRPGTHLPIGSKVTVVVSTR